MSDAIHSAMMDDPVREYAESIDPAHRPLFDRMHRLVLDVRPEATVAISYGIPTYRAGRRRLYVGAWKHGLSIYGWKHDGGFIDRHPELKTSKGTIRLRPQDATGIPDEEFRDFLRAAFSD